MDVQEIRFFIPYPVLTYEQVPAMPKYQQFERKINVNLDKIEIAGHF